MEQDAILETAYNEAVAAETKTKAELEASGFNTQSLPDAATRTLLHAHQAAVAAAKEAKKRLDASKGQLGVMQAFLNRLGEAVGGGPCMPVSTKDPLFTLEF